MANANKPMGLSPHSYINGAKWTGQATMYAIPTSDTSNTYAVGDPVILAGGGDAAGIPTVTKITYGDNHPILGAIVGVIKSGNVYGGALGAGGNQFDSPVILAGTRTATVYCMVADDPMLLFTAQEVSGGTQFAAADAGANTNLIAGALGTNLTSQDMLDNTSNGTTSTFQIQLMRLLQTPNNTFGAFAKWVVRINNHAFRAGTAGY